MDQLGAPDKDEDKLVTKLRNRLSLFLKEIRDGAEGIYIYVWTDRKNVKCSQVVCVCVW